MTDETWLRDALSRATARQPAGGDRAGRAFALVARRRRQRLVAASCTAVAGVFVATALTAGGTTSAGLEPVSPASSATATGSAAPRSGGRAVAAPPGGRPGGPHVPARPAGAARPGPAGGTGGVSGATAAGRPALDVYFLVDATSSMNKPRGEIRRAVEDIVERLRTKTTLRHGFGGFRDVTLSTGMLDPVYERYAPLRTAGGSLPRIDYAGGGDTPEGHTFALDAAIGVAHEPWTVDPAPAGFAAAARKLVIIATDAPMSTEDTHPAPADVVRRLNAAGVAVASLVVAGADYDLAERDMRWLALKTGATARRGGDCNGDGIRDLRRGGPLVCGVLEDRGYDYTAFADAILARWF